MEQKKYAIVTGGTKGIGRGVVDMLVRKEYTVFVTYAHDEDAAKQLIDIHGDKVILHKTNHAVRTETYAFIDFVKSVAPHINCIVCNAGITIRTSFTEMKDSDWDSMFEVSVHSHVILLRELFSLIQPQSRIIFTGSSMANHPHATVLGYGVTKSGVHALALNLVKVFEHNETTVNVIAPGFVETEWQKNKPQEIRNNICAKTAIHRFSTIEEAVRAYEFCIDNAFINGAVLNVDGGYSYK